MADKVGSLYYDVTLETSSALAQSRRMQQENQRTGASFDALGAKVSKVAAAVSAALAAIAVEGLVSRLVSTQRQFDVLFSSLKTVTGGADQAGSAFERLRDFASKTPYTLEQSVKGFVKLKALGLDPSERALTSFGNTASAMGKNLEQMIEAVADASTGEFERLKEFGIKARVEGDKVALTFQGVTTRIGNNAQEITEYLTKIGEVQFAGAMSERMKTLDGDISNLQDTVDALFLTLSKSGAGDAIAKGVRLATEAIQELSTSVNEGGLTEYFDGLKPIIAGVEVVAVSLAGAIAGRLVAAFVAMAAQAYASVTALGAATVAARGFAAVMTALGGPIGIAITGLALLALNWDKVAGSARNATTISEQGAERIAAALRKSPGRATQDLAEQLKDAQRQIADFDKQIGSPRTVGRGVLVSRTGAEIDELRKRRAAAVGVAADIQRAMDSLHAGQGRSRGPGGVIVDPDKPPPPPPPKDKFDDAAYLAGLTSKRLDGIAAVDAAEAEALRKNNDLRARGQIDAGTHAKALTEIEANAAQDRLDIQLRFAEERRAAIEEAGREEIAASMAAQQERVRQEEDAERGRALARGIIGQADPVAALQQELEAKSALLLYHATIDQENAELYAEAQVTLERETQRKLSELRQREIDQQNANNAQSLAMLGQFTGDVFTMLQQAGRQRTALAKAAFLANKAIAVAEIIMNTEVAAAKAGAQLGIFGLPMAAMIRATGYASAGLVGGQALADTFGGGRQFGGPVNAGSMYRVNETGRPEMFTAANGSQFMLPTTSGNVTPANEVGGAGVAVHWTINCPPGTTARVDERRRQIDIEAAVNETASQVIERRGPMWAALKTTDVRGQQ